MPVEQYELSSVRYKIESLEGRVERIEKERKEEAQARHRHELERLEAERKRSERQMWIWLTVYWVIIAVVTSAGATAVVLDAIRDD